MGRTSGTAGGRRSHADFADENALDDLRSPESDRPLIVTRTLSKSYALAGIRFGFAVTTPELVRELTKVKDSYNCDVLSLTAAAAALDDQAYLQATRQDPHHTRASNGSAGDVGFSCHTQPGEFRVVPSGRSAGEADLRSVERSRHPGAYMVYEGYGDGLRITVGSDAEIDRLVEELTRLV